MVIPNSILVPGQFQLIDNSGAGEVSEVKRCLIVDIKTATGTATSGIPIQVSSAQQARDLLGEGSPAAIAAINFLAHASGLECWVMPLGEPASGAAGVWDVPLTATTAVAGTIVRELNGVRLELAVAAAETADTIAANLVALINSKPDLQVEASTTAGANKITLTAKVKGEYTELSFTKPSGATDPVGVTIGDLAEDTAPSGTVDLADALAAMDGTTYRYFVSTIFDSAAQLAWQQDLEKRYQPLHQNDGRLFVAISGPVGNATTPNSMIAQAATGLNSPHIVLVPRGENAQYSAIWAAVWGAVVGSAMAWDPAANIIDTTLPSLLGTMYTFDERQALLEAGIATYKVDAAGSLRIERVVTSYNETSDGSRDTSYLDLQVVETISAIRASINAEAAARYKTWKLAQVEGDYGPGSKVMTADIFKGFLATLYSERFLKQLAWVDDEAGYIDSIQVNVTSNTRLEYIHEPRLIGQFLQAVGTAAYR